MVKKINFVVLFMRAPSLLPLFFFFNKSIGNQGK